MRQQKAFLARSFLGVLAFMLLAPRVEAEAIAPIVEFMEKKPIAVETIADNSIIDRLVQEGFIDKLYAKR